MLKWFSDTEFYPKENRAVKKWNYTAPDGTIWSSYIETDKGNLCIDTTVFESAVATQIYCETLAKEKIAAKIKFLESIL